MTKGRIEIDENLCKGCTLCTSVCPKDLIEMSSDQLTPRGYHPAIIIDPDIECTGCMICGVICPDSAIIVYRWVPEEKAIPLRLLGGHGA
jgi:2-oxoglutarate ferredoxin oxidoreductase subunit delta